MKRRYGLIALAAVAALGIASPAFGGPSAFDLAARAFKGSEQAKSKAKQADRRARAAKKRARAAHRRITRAKKVTGRVNVARRKLRLRIASLEAQTAADAALPGVIGRSTFSDAVCQNDETDHWEEFADQFQQCGETLTLDVPEEHRLLVNAAVGWFTDGTGALGQCTILENGSPAGPVVATGNRTDTTGKDSPGENSLTVVLPPRRGQTELAVGCRERMSDIDWTDISLSAVAIDAR